MIRVETTAAGTVTVLAVEDTRVSPLTESMPTVAADAWLRARTVSVTGEAGTVMKTVDSGLQT